VAETKCWRGVMMSAAHNTTPLVDNPAEEIEKMEALRSLFPTERRIVGRIAGGFGFCATAAGPRSRARRRLLAGLDPERADLLTGEPDTGYPHYKKAQVEAHVNEAWQCLKRDGFIGPSPRQNGRNGWMSLTRAGEEASKSTDAFERIRVRSRPPLVKRTR